MIEEKSKDLKTLTRAFALRIMRLFGALPKTTEAQAIGRQMLDSGTSVGAHYLEAMRARSPAEFILAAMLVSSAKTTKERNSHLPSKRSPGAIREESVMYSTFIAPHSSFITPHSSFIVTVFGGAR